jgi:hypothetical protein
MMGWPMVTKRGEIYYLRMTVPLRVQAAYGAKDVWLSLRTRNLDEARVLALAASAKIRATFKRLEGHTVSMEPDELATLYQQRALAEDAQHRRDSALKPQGDEDDTDERESLALTTRLEELDEDPSKINALLDRVLFDFGVRVPHDDRTRYAHALLMSHRKTLERILDRVSASPDDALAADLGPTVAELVEAYLKDRGLSVKTANEIRTTTSRFSHAIGGRAGANRRARGVTRADVRRWRADVLASDRAPATQKKALVTLSTIWKYGLTAGLVESNIWDGMTSVPRRGSASPPTRIPYTRLRCGCCWQSPRSSKVLATGSSGCARGPGCALRRVAGRERRT